MNLMLPSALAGSAHMSRLLSAINAARGAGAGLVALRDRSFSASERAGQLKTSVDAASEGWVLGFLESEYSGERFLAEERHDNGAQWSGADDFWTVDALDGTRSYVDGFDTWCVQIAWVESGAVRVGVVHEPVAARTYVAIRGHGAFLISRDEMRRLHVRGAGWHEQPRFIDSTRPTGPVATIMQQRAGRFVECGSIGLKICRVAEGTADVFVKPLRFKLWDVAPGGLVLEEAGGRVCTWDGRPISYDVASPIYHQDILAAPADAIDTLARDLNADTRRASS